MAKKPHPGDENLKPVRTVEEAREKGRRGGQASGRARREKRNQRELAKYFMSLPLNRGPLDEIETLNDINGKNLTGGEILLLAQFQKALKGDTRAYEAIRDTAGEKPADHIEVNTDIQEAETLITQQINAWKAERNEEGD